MADDEENESVDNAPMVPKVLPVIFFILILLALAIGAWFYLPQLSVTPIDLWLFVPDCPLYAFLGGLLVLWHFPRNQTWDFVIGSGLAIYGSWTILVLFLYPGTYFAADQFWMSAVLVAGHLGMIAEGLLVLPKKATWYALLIALVWFGANTYLDYHLGLQSTHPWIPTGHLGLVEQYTWAAGILFPVLFYFISGKVWAHPLTRKIHHMLCWIC